MIEADDFMTAATSAGFDFYTGVPCSYLTPLINGVLSNRALRYVGAASEGEAVAIAAGAWLAGRTTVAMCQNSGLGNMVNPLTSLNAPFRIPTLLVTTWRGRPGEPDEPQHEVMGAITHRLLDLMGIPNAAFPSERDEIAPALEQARRIMEGGVPQAFVLAKGAVADTPLDQPGRGLPAPGVSADYRRHGVRPARIAILEQFLALTDDSTAVIATTGKAGRELFTLADRPQHLYQVGSMGCASAMGLGVAVNSERLVVVIDGDGAALMKLGSLATIGAQSPPNLVHILLDNEVHDSTGGQATVSASVDFATVALAAGYGYAARVDDAAGFARAWGEARATRRPAMIHVKIAPGSLATLGRPTVKPHAVAARFRAFLAS